MKKTRKSNKFGLGYQGTFGKKIKHIKKRKFPFKDI